MTANILINISSFGLGITEIFYLGLYSKTANSCYNVWEWIMADGLSNIVLGGIMILFDIKNFIDLFKKNINSDETMCLIAFMRIGYFAIGTGVFVIYLMIEPSCHDYWKNIAPQFIVIITIIIVRLWICAILGISWQIVTRILYLTGNTTMINLQSRRLNRSVVV